MKVLVTGALGNIGQSTILSLLNHGHEVTAFDIENRKNHKTVKRLGIRTIWGDVREMADLEKAVEGQDVVIHLAFIIPSLSATGKSSEAVPQWAQEINVGGTRNLIAAMEAQPVPPRLIFASSCAIYGRTQHLKPPRRIIESPNPIEHYSRHKVLCEQMVRSSQLTWAITRFAAALPISMAFDVGMFGVPLSDRMEFIHTRDLGDALANAVDTEGIWGKTLHLGGGPRCQMRFQEIATNVLEGIGLGMLPDEAFTNVPFHTDWLDTKESQELLHYQKRDINDYVKDMQKHMGWRVRAARFFRPLIRKAVLKKSLPYKRAHAHPEWADRVALVTGASQGIGQAIALELALDGLQVVLTARNAEKLEQVAESIAAFGGKAIVIPADLTIAEERRRLLNSIKARFGTLDVLVNNAGTAWYGYASSMPAEQVSNMLTLNVESTTDLIFSALADMVRKGQGHIINIGSVAGRIPSQGVALYSATKAYIEALTTSLHRESSGTGVHVSLINAGAVATPFYESAGMRQNGKPFFVERWAVSTEVIAKAVSKLLAHPRRVVYVPFSAHLAPWGEALFGWLMDRIGPVLLRRQATETPV